MTILLCKTLVETIPQNGTCQNHSYQDGKFHKMCMTVFFCNRLTAGSTKNNSSSGEYKEDLSMKYFSSLYFKLPGISNSSSLNIVGIVIA